MEIRQCLQKLEDKEYKAFHSKLVPTVDPDTIIGVRVPKLRAFAKEISGSEEASEFLSELPHAHYDENTLHAVLLSMVKDYNKAEMMTEAFLPYIDNWAVCDILNPKVFGKNKEELIKKIPQWIESPAPYTCRFGMEMLMNYFLDADFKPEYLAWPAKVRSDEYYVNMMTAWFFATALAKQWKDAVIYVEEHRLDRWTHNKTIQKAVESFRITDEQKKYLKSKRYK